MSFLKNLFSKKEEDEKNVAPKAKQKDAKRTMPEVNGKELYRQEKEKRRIEAQKRREEEEKIKEQERQAELARLEQEKEQKAKEQEEKLVQLRAEQEKREAKTTKETKVEREVIDAYGFEIVELQKGDVVEVELLAEERDKFIAQANTNFQNVVIPKIELENITVDVGDVIEVQIFKYYADEYYGSYRRLQNRRNLEQQLSTLDKEQVVTGKVISYKEPIFIVELDNGLKGKVFIKNIDTKFVSDVRPYLEKTFDFVIKEKILTGNINFELDRRSLIMQKQDELLQNISVGQVLEISDYSFNKGGIEFTYNGIRGFVPISELSHSFIRNIEQAENIVSGPQNVQIMEIEKRKNYTNLICSIKILQPKPWDLFVENFKEGSKVTGKIVKKEQYGLFINIIDGVDGLLHNSKYSNEIGTEIKTINVGDEISCYIESIDTTTNKVGLTCIEESQNNE